MSCLFRALKDAGNAREDFSAETSSVLTGRGIVTGQTTAEIARTSLNASGFGEKSEKYLHFNIVRVFQSRKIVFLQIWRLRKAREAL